MWPRMHARVNRLSCTMACDRQLESRAFTIYIYIYIYVYTHMLYICETRRHRAVWEAENPPAEHPPLYHIYIYIYIHSTISNYLRLYVSYYIISCYDVSYYLTRLSAKEVSLLSRGRDPRVECKPWTVIQQNGMEMECKQGWVAQEWIGTCWQTTPRTLYM